MKDADRLEGNHPDAEALDRYRRRTATPDELLATDAHLATCDECFHAVRAEHDSVELPSAGDKHLTYEELEAFVDGRADALDRELVTAHTAQCAQCAAELADVKATRDALAPRAPRPAAQLRRVPR